MRIFYYLAVSLLFTVTHVSVFGQNNSKLRKNGEQFLRKGEFDKAIIYFSSLDTSEINGDPFYDYYMGVSYYNSPNNQENGIQYLENYISKVDSTEIAIFGNHHVYYLLGKLYHLNLNFDLAEKFYTTFLTEIENADYIPEIEKEKMRAQVNREIEQCHFGKVALKNPRNVIIESLGDSINTIYPEYAAIVSQDEKQLFFTSRRPDTEGGKKDRDGYYFEDIYEATLAKGSLFDITTRDTITTNGFYFSLVTDFLYEDFRRMNQTINSNAHDGSVQLYKKDKEILFYRDNDIWSAPLKGDSLSEAKKMGVYINSDHYEPSVFFSYDGKRLFIVSDREGGLGGLDIYCSQLDNDGVWGTPVNMGPNINTPFDEDAPYLDPDEITFYFSSKGHSSMGEYDIFRSKNLNNTWSTAVNLGYPINTPAEDIYFTMTNRYNRGYYSSSDLKGRGDMDIYRITFSDERDPVAELKGFVKEGDKLVPARSKIKLSIKETGEEISTETDTLKGDYFLLLGHGKTYSMDVETKTFKPYHHDFEIPEQKEYFQLYQEIHHVHLLNNQGDTLGQKITVFNALGESDTTITWYEGYNEELKIKLNRIGYELDYNGLISVDSEVKFYMTFDEFVELMQEDTSLHFDFPPDARVEFVDENDPTKFRSVSLLELNEAIGKDRTSNIVIAERNFEAKDTVDNIVPGLFFTVQIGVYSKPIPMSVLFNLPNINSQITAEKNMRYSTGRFSSVAEATVRKDEICTIGIVDAFVTAYYQGKRISPTKANALIEEFGMRIIAKDLTQ